MKHFCEKATINITASESFTLTTWVKISDRKNEIGTKNKIIEFGVYH